MVRVLACSLVLVAVAGCTARSAYPDLNQLQPVATQQFEPAAAEAEIAQMRSRASRPPRAGTSAERQAQLRQTGLTHGEAAINRLENNGNN